MRINWSSWAGVVVLGFIGLAIEHFLRLTDIATAAIMLAVGLAIMSSGGFNLAEWLLDHIWKRQEKERSMSNDVVWPPENQGLFWLMMATGFGGLVLTIFVNDQCWPTIPLSLIGLLISLWPFIKSFFQIIVEG